jgi:hypothetical protein
MDAAGQQSVLMPDDAVGYLMAQPELEIASPFPVVSREGFSLDNYRKSVSLLLAMDKLRGYDVPDSKNVGVYLDAKVRGKLNFTRYPAKLTYEDVGYLFLDTDFESRPEATSGDKKINSIGFLKHFRVLDWTHVTGQHIERHDVVELYAWDMGGAPFKIELKQNVLEKLIGALGVFGKSVGTATRDLSCGLTLSYSTVFPEGEKKIELGDIDISAGYSNIPGVFVSSKPHFETKIKAAPLKQ